MGFVDEYNNPLINEEQKVRITLSSRAKTVMNEDMENFAITKSSSFINTVFTNFREEAKSSISLYLEQRELELKHLFSDAKLDEISKEICIEKILSAEKEKVIKKVMEYQSLKGESKLYHINDNNVKYLIEDCHEEKYYKRPGLYLRSVIEEYCSLPFIKRVRIFKKDIFDIVERACRERRILKIKATNYLKSGNFIVETYLVYPYKIVADPLHTQSYLVCYSRSIQESEDKLKLASFSMARLNPPTMSQTFHLTKQKINFIESQISKYSPAYLIETNKQIKVKLTDNGKRSYQSRLYSRPEKIEALSNSDTYVFDCSPQQIFNYFFPFGEDAEIISPSKLRKRFLMAHRKSLYKYEKKSSITCNDEGK